MNKNTTIGKLITILAVLSGVVGLAIAFTPLRMMAIYPALVGLWISLFALIIASKNKASKKGPIVALIISGVALSGAYILENTVKDKIVKDEKFEQTIDQTAKEAEEGNDLDDALDELE